MKVLRRNNKRARTAHNIFTVIEVQVRKVGQDRKPVNCHPRLDRDVTGNIRMSILLVSVFFVIGFWMLLNVPKEERVLERT